jgi:hypothetical protein
VCYHAAECTCMSLVCCDDVQQLGFLSFIVSSGRRDQWKFPNPPPPLYAPVSSIISTDLRIVKFRNDGQFKFTTWKIEHIVVMW